MNKLIIIVTLLSFSYSFSQNNNEDAFSKSYINEINQDYQKAIDDLLVLDTFSYNINLRLGWLHYLNGDYNKSKTYYNNAIALEKSSIEAKFGLIYPISAMLNLDEVIAIYNDILEINANNTIVNYQLAAIYFTRKDWYATENYLTKILKLYPFDYNSNLLLGRTYIKNGKIKEAKKVLQNALEYNPQSNDVLGLLKGL